ncbi:MAG: hypothetical protein PHE29_01685 [Tissierellia bacterium]|nr:hypothetical protein [Tissierellia bacterium]
MDKLIFLVNELQNPIRQRELHIPLTFISFGFIKGKLYKHYHSKSTFAINDMNKKWGNETVYGGLFLCKDFNYYARILDAYHVCSMSTLYRNHIRDIHHRTKINITTISFNSLNDLARLKYNETTQIKAETYIGNPNHPNISKRVLCTNHTYRIIDGIDVNNFKTLYREVVDG